MRKPLYYRHFFKPVGALHSLVVRQLWELDVGGSNPSAPTIFEDLWGRGAIG